ncbi:hypothetical protein K2173_017287 [Erythroxylum novogranatense]|uniref:Uncharacterized protein n=1 Tax=Erythroxylum novogranatense TaxID=1862640 RepID=A0AAV8U9Z7_9ROSI|nr:hypothetical protein K2173_017287 [Erythroxylum novogranatense]
MMIDITSPPSPIGFEGFKNRLEITFSKPPFSNPTNINLILEPAFCIIVDQLYNTEFDSYVLSESSLFVYPLKMILKTYGTTKLLHSIVPLLKLVDSLSPYVTNVQYSREVAFFNKFFGILNTAAYVLGYPNHWWRIYSAQKVTVIFYKKSEKHVAKEMITSSRIYEIFPTHMICDHSFDPCGDSMNEIEGASLSSMHVMLEEGFSYGSYEAIGFNFTCKSVVKQKLPSGECLVYKTYR